MVWAKDLKNRSKYFVLCVRFYYITLHIAHVIDMKFFDMLSNQSAVAVIICHLDLITYNLILDVLWVTLSEIDVWVYEPNGNYSRWLSYLDEYSFFWVRDLLTKNSLTSQTSSFDYQLTILETIYFYPLDLSSSELPNQQCHLWFFSLIFFQNCITLKVIRSSRNDLLDFSLKIRHIWDQNISRIKVSL